VCVCVCVCACVSAGQRGGAYFDVDFKIL